MVNIGYTVKLKSVHIGVTSLVRYDGKRNQKGPLKEVKFPHYRRTKQKIIKKKIMQVPGKRYITSQRQQINLKNNIYLIKSNDQSSSAVNRRNRSVTMKSYESIIVQRLKDVTPSVMR